MKRYRVDAQAPGSKTWEPIHYTNSLPVARRYADQMRKAPTVKTTRVVNQLTGMEINQ
ncbi:MAG: hypothetical protein GY832_32090 [Chloroflexi bacterium]|nr:hypothetical protein [Chloroflexota bacterium]